MLGKFLNNRTTTWGVVLVILGVSLSVLGVAAFANYSVICPVTPGDCILQYQVWFLVLLYPFSGSLTVLGSLLAIFGAILTILGQLRNSRLNHDVSKISQEPNRAT